jgi:hypothetical protein
VIDLVKVPDRNAWNLTVMQSWRVDLRTKWALCPAFGRPPSFRGAAGYNDSSANEPQTASANFRKGNLVIDHAGRFVQFAGLFDPLHPRRLKTACCRVRLNAVQATSTSESRVLTLSIYSPLAKTA